VKIISIFMCFIVLSGCMTVADLKKPTKEQIFTISNDYVRMQVRGWENYKWVEGLKAGRYTSIGEDDEGVYFIGSGRSVIKLANEHAEKYLKTRKIPEEVLKNKGVLESAVHVGGIFIPKNGVNIEPKLFYEVRNTTDGNQFGITGYTIVMLSEGTLTYIPYKSEKEFISGLKIIDK